MGTDEKIRALLQETPGDVPAFEGNLKHVVARAGIRRWRKRAAGAGVAVVLLAGVALPLGLLYGLRSDNRHVGTATTSSTPVPSPSASPSPPPPGWVRHTDSAGISIDTPSAWGFNDDPVPGSPTTLFALGTGPVRTGGDCAPTAALGSLPADGVLIDVMEYGSVDQPYSFPPRSDAFDLGPLSGPFECWGVKTHLILFEDGGRYFQAHIVFGPDAPASLREQVLQSLDSLQVDPLPASEQRAALCSAGQWTTCPEAAWVYEVINEANVFHLGNRDDDAILGLEHDRSFALWTTPASEGGPQGTDCVEVAGLETCKVGEQMYMEVQGVRLWIEPAPSPYESLRTQAALPDRETLGRLVRAALSVRLVEPSG
jgi:hypothetical protein